MSAASPQQRPATPAANPRWVYLPAAALAIVGAGGALWLGGVALVLVVLYDGALAASVVAAAAGWGAWPTVWFGLGRREALQQVCVAVALGLGWLGVLTLVVGVAGWLSPTLAWVLIAAGWAIGLARIILAPTPEAPAGATRPALWRTALVALLLLALAVPLVIGLFAATIPPGVLWNAENKGYDALEYHLQGPREYYEAGHIHFLPHNVYTSFPQQMEMLYLLLMYMADGPWTGAVAAQLLHLLCGGFAVLALVAWTRPGWARVVVALVAGSVPWLAYLGALAYVEMGMLLFASVAAGLLLRDVQRRQGAGQATPVAPTPWRVLFLAGICAGLAGGCKYTALVLIVVALLVAWLVVMRGGFGRRLRGAVIFGCGAVLAFSPWLIRNAAFTGNPVYPFAYSWFGGKAWDAELDARWERGHHLPPAQADLASRARTVYDELLAARMFGPGVFVLGLLGVVAGRRRGVLLLLIWLLMMVSAWAALTHMPGRFVVPTVIPLALLAGLAVPRNWAWRLSARATAGVTTVVVLLAAGSAVWNGVTLRSILVEHEAWWAEHGVPLPAFVGATEALAAAQPINDLVPPTAHAYLVGEARVFYVAPEVDYSVVFSRDPWLAHAAQASPAAAIDWLRTQGVSHVVFSWREIRRLQATYGFPEFVTPGWVARLEMAGLRRKTPDPGPGLLPPTEVYEVP